MPTGETFSGQIKSEEYGYASGYSAGVTWYADLRGYDVLYVADALYGHGEFTLEKKLQRQVVQKCMGIMCILLPAFVPALQFPSSDRSLFQVAVFLTNEATRKLLAIR